MNEPGGVIGVDIGGTRTKVALLEPSGRLLDFTVRDTPAGLGRPDGPDPADFIAGLVAPHRVRACGVVVPGIVDDAAGTVHFGGNLGWCDLDLRTAVQARLGLPTSVGHDVRAGLVAETRWGAAASSGDVLFVPIGTGIAAAIRVDGVILRASGWAGEIGHVVVEPGGPPCGCGARGCLEAVSSASAIARAYSEQAGRRHSAAEVAALVEAGDPRAASIWDRAVTALAGVIAAVLSGTGIRLVLVGGGLVNAGALLLDPLARALRERVVLGDPVQVRSATMGERAGAIGAATWALDLLGTEPGEAGR